MIDCGTIGTGLYHLGMLAKKVGRLSDLSGLVMDFPSSESSVIFGLEHLEFCQSFSYLGFSCGQSYSTRDNSIQNKSGQRPTHNFLLQACDSHPTKRQGIPHNSKACDRLLRVLVIQSRFSAPGPHRGNSNYELQFTT